MAHLRNRSLILTIIFITFLSVFIIKSVINMVAIPFHDFDEAHRAENAKKMKEYQSFFVPLTGSSFDRVEELKIPLKENHDFYLYYHLERPPLVYIFMVLSTAVFGEKEWAYRLPSFLFGIGIFITLLFFVGKENSKNLFAIGIGILSVLTSSDLWLSSQYAQMDTAITLFLTLSIITLLSFCNNKKSFLVYLAGAFFGLALLSKLQPAVIFTFPIIYLLLLRKLNIASLIRFILGFSIIFLPWIFYLALKFGLGHVLQIMPGFAWTSASLIDIHHQAPVFWYVRWFWESLRPGWTIFLALLFYDIFKIGLNWQKKVLIAYILGGLLAFSIPVNKLWWYVLPLIPAIAYYIYLSASDYLKEEGRITNLSFAVIVSSLPLFIGASNTMAMIYGVVVTVLCILILNNNLNLRLNLLGNKQSVYYASIVFGLVIFLLQFPKIVPYHWNTKPVAEYYRSLPYPKCLWLGDMPAEAALFYSDSGELPLLNKNSRIFYNCQNNYLITPSTYKDGELVFRSGNIFLYKL